MDYKKNITDYFVKLQQTLNKVSVKEVNNLINVLETARNNDSTIFIMGNGGSSATASHYVCDFNKGVSLEQINKYKIISLNDNIPSIMAYANDISFDEIFVRQLKTYFKPNDLVIGISGSGNSTNVLKAIQYANNNRGISVSLTGFNGGEIGKIAKYNVNVPINDMQITEDIHMILCHTMMKILSNAEY